VTPATPPTDAAHPLDAEIFPLEAGQQPADGFFVQTETFTGSLAELANALRSGKLEPKNVNLLRLAKAYLVYYDRVAQKDIELATETLPALARVIEVKARLLLPRPPREADEEEAEAELGETLDVVAVLEELEGAIFFLRQRRQERCIILPARAPKPEYPRPERPIRVSLGKLAEMASRYRTTSYFELAVDRLSMSAAIKHLQDALKRVRRALLRDLVPARDWAAFVVSFAGMLELVKEGQARAHQEAPYAPIELERVDEAEAVRDVA
jgi:segregation and condensation protein A